MLLIFINLGTGGKKMKKAVSLLLSFVMVMSVFAVSLQAFASDYVADSDARSMLTTINDFRTGSDAWYWNESDTEKVQATGLATLQYDEELEKIAKIRAEELSRGNGTEYFSHTRPDGTKYYTCTVKDANGNTVASSGENIAVGLGGPMSVEGAFNAWLEKDNPYSGQGHRRNMLKNTFVRIGIAGYVCDNGNTYWVQEFGVSKDGGAPVAPVVVKKANTLKASAKKVTVKYSKLKKKNQTINVGKAMTVSNAKGTVSYKKSSGNGKITINKKTGKITVKKGLKKGTYKVKIKVTAAGNATYKAATKTVTVKIKVK